jgi:hypothetical protein
MGVNGQRHPAVAINPRKITPGTHWIGGWVAPRAGVDTEAKKEVFSARDGWVQGLVND